MSVEAQAQSTRQGPPASQHPHSNTQLTHSHSWLAMEAVKSGLRWLLGPGIENLSLVPPLPAGGSNPTATPANVYTYHNQVDEGDAVDHFWSGVAEGPWGLVTSRYTLAVIIMVSSAASLAFIRAPSLASC